MSSSSVRVWAVVALAGCTGTVEIAAPASSTADAQAIVDAGGGSDAALEASVDGVVSAGDAGLVDAGARDGAVAEAGASDAGGDAAVLSAGCAGGRFLWCEDFEGASDGALPAGWSVLMGWGGGSAPKVVSDTKHAGQRALETGVAATGQTRVQHSLSGLGASANKHWGRVFFKAKAPVPPPANGVLHNTLVALRGADESRVVDTVINTAGAHQFLYNIPDDSFGKGSPYDYHAYDGGWHCAEWFVDTATRSYRFFYDGNEVTAIAFSGEAGARLDGFDNIALGFIGYQTPSTPYDGWFDDLALHDARIGCD